MHKVIVIENTSGSSAAEQLEISKSISFVKGHEEEEKLWTPSPFNDQIKKVSRYTQGHQPWKQNKSDFPVIILVDCHC